MAELPTSNYTLLQEEVLLVCSLVLLIWLQYLVGHSLVHVNPCVVRCSRKEVAVGGKHEVRHALNAVSAAVEWAQVVASIKHLQSTHRACTDFTDVIALSDMHVC
jgi:hypothetical protein